MKIGYLLFLLMPFAVFAQDSAMNHPVRNGEGLPLLNGQVVFESIDTVKSYSQDKIYAASKSWLAEHFASANSVIQMDDKSAGKLIGKIIFKPVGPNVMNYSFTGNLSIDSRPEKARFRLYDITYTAYGDPKIYKLDELPNKKSWPELSASVDALIISYRVSLSKAAADNF